MTVAYNIAIICGTAAVIVALVGALYADRCRCRSCRDRGRTPRSLP